MSRSARKGFKRAGIRGRGRKWLESKILGVLCEECLEAGDKNKKKEQKSSLSSADKMWLRGSQCSP